MSPPVWIDGDPGRPGGWYEHTRDGHLVPWPADQPYTGRPAAAPPPPETPFPPLPAPDPSALGGPCEDRPEGERH